VESGSGSCCKALLKHPAGHPDAGFGSHRRPDLGRPPHCFVPEQIAECRGGPVAPVAAGQDSASDTERRGAEGVIGLVVRMRDDELGPPAAQRRRGAPCPARVHHHRHPRQERAKRRGMGDVNFRRKRSRRAVLWRRADQLL
jgi:hypothetical protein